MPRPERVFKVGAVRAVIFKNAIAGQGETVYLPKIIIEVRYRDPAGNWKGTSSLSLNDLPKAILALQNAYAYLLEDKRSDWPGKQDSEQSKTNCKEVKRQ